MNKATSASEEVISEFRLCLDSAIATGELAPTDVKYIVGLLESCFRQIADDAIQAVRTAPSEQQINWNNEVLRLNGLLRVAQNEITDLKRRAAAPSEELQRLINAALPNGTEDGPATVEQAERAIVQYREDVSEAIRQLREADAAAAPSELIQHQADAWNRLVAVLIVDYGLKHTEPGEVMLEQVLNFLKRKLGAPSESDKWLGEILAIIHGDGGHYQSEHGTERATKDAIAKYHELLSRCERDFCP